MAAYVVESADRGAPLDTLTALPGAAPVDDEPLVVGIDGEGHLLATDGSLWPAGDPATVRLLDGSDQGTPRCIIVGVALASLQCVVVPLDVGRGVDGIPPGAVSLAVVGQTIERDDVFGGIGPRIAVAAFVGIIAALILTIHLSRTIAAPLRNISRAARRVAQGNYQQRVAVSGTTEVRDLARQFNHMTEQVQAARQTLRDFLINITHEFKTPLTSIHGFSGAMLDGTIDDDDGRRRAATVIEQESQRLLRLVQDLLDLSRIENGQITMRTGNFEIGELLFDVAELFERRALEAGVTLNVVPVEHLSVVADADRVEQVLQNLVTNALNHTPPGGHVALSAIPDGRRRVRVNVADTGCGMRPDEAANVFDRFYRAGTSADGKGHGIGLAICREIVRAHGGEIWVETEPKKGATFSFTLPTSARAAKQRAARPR
jgi:signal transduction histidine kinase